MNLSDIFLNNGQLNWDAIGAISNIVLVTALVLITYWYAKKVGEQTDLMVKDAEKNKILEEVQEVLTPTIYHLEKEIEAIQNNEIFWSVREGVGEFGPRYHRPGYGGEETIKRLFDASSAVFKDVIHTDTDLESKFISHDNFREKLNELYTEVERVVKTSKLKERLKVLVNKFNESREEAYRLRGGHFEKPERIFGNFITNFRYQIERTPDAIQPHIDFWEEYRDELLKFRDTPQIKELDKEIEGTLSQLKELDEALLEKIEEIREEYRVKYNFTKYKIDPKLREVEEW
jgi:uncharacterized coiled-coil protein SlyX